MKTLRLFLCGMVALLALASCAYDDYPGGYSTVTYQTETPSYRYRTVGATRLSPYYPYGSGYIYRTSAPRTYVTNRYVTPVGTTRTYVQGYPVNPYMSVGGYGYVPPAPRLDPWPLR